MRFVLSTALLVGLTGCPGTGKDTGDTSGTPTDSTDTNTTPIEFMLLEDATGMVTGTGVTGSCASNQCVYTMTTTTEASLLELDMTETDDEFLYTENHTGFALDSNNADGSFTYKLVLDAVGTPEEVVVNSTTLFYADSVLDGTTWYFGATSLDGMSTDCVVNGNSSTYYSEWCANYEG